MLLGINGINMDATPIKYTPLLAWALLHIAWGRTTVRGSSPYLFFLSPLGDVLNLPLNPWPQPMPQGGDCSFPSTAPESFIQSLRGSLGAINRAKSLLHLSGVLIRLGKKEGPSSD